MAYQDYKRGYGMGEGVSLSHIKQ